MSTIDLRPAAARGDGRELPQRLSAGIVLCLLLLLGSVHVARSRDLDEALAAQRRVAANHARLQGMVRELEGIDARRAQAQASLAVLHEQRTAATQLACTLRRVAAALPEVAWLDEIEWSQGSLRLVGGAVDPAVVSVFRAGLGTEMQQLRVESTHLDESATTAVDFAVTIDANPAADPPTT